MWLLNFKEENRAVVISGICKTNNPDVAQFMLRLGVSRYFSDVRLVKTEDKKDKDTTGDVPAIAFEIRAKVRY